MNKVLVVGSLNMDLIVETDRIPKLGETVLGGSFATVPGGKGANQAAAAARLGAETAMVGCVGADAFGARLTEGLAGDGVDVSRIQILADVPTGIADILLQKGDNCIIVAPGANSCVTAAQVREAEAVFAACDVVLAQLEIPLEAVEEAAALAEKYGKLFLLNPAPAAALPKTLLRRVGLLTPNESEAQALTGIAAETLEGAEQAAKALLEQGAAQVVITLGSQGCIYSVNGAIRHMAAVPAQAVDTTAAGDCFSAALAVQLSRGKILEEAVRVASVAGSLTVRKKGAQNSLPTWQEVEVYL